MRLSNPLLAVSGLIAVTAFAQDYQVATRLKTPELPPFTFKYKEARRVKIVHDAQDICDELLSQKRYGKPIDRATLTKRIRDLDDALVDDLRVMKLDKSIDVSRIPCPKDFKNCAPYALMTLQMLNTLRMLERVSNAPNADLSAYAAMIDTVANQLFQF